jgi:hypothetical protein
MPEVQPAWKTSLVEQLSPHLDIACRKQHWASGHQYYKGGFEA